MREGHRPDDRKPPPRKPDKPKKDAAKKPVPPSQPVPTVDPMNAERTRAEAALMRRLEVCDKLKEIALRNNDAELLRKAEQLDERVRSAYVQHTGNLPSTFESDEKTLAKHLGSANANGKGSSQAAARTVPGSDRTSQASIKEVNR